MDSVGSMAAPAGAPNFAICTIAQFDTYWQGLTEPQRIVAEQTAFTTGSDSIKIAVLIKRDNSKTVELGQVRNQLTAAQQLAQQATVAAATARAAAASPPPKFKTRRRI